MTVAPVRAGLVAVAGGRAGAAAWRVPYFPRVGGGSGSVGSGAQIVAGVENASVSCLYTASRKIKSRGTSNAALQELSPKQDQVVCLSVGIVEFLAKGCRGEGISKRRWRRIGGKIC